MKRRMMLFICLLAVYAGTSQEKFQLEAVKAYPFPYELVAATAANTIAWVMNEQGIRNVFVAAGPEFKVKKITQYQEDDGQEISSLQISPDGRWIVYIRGGDFGSNWDLSSPVNPAHLPLVPKVEAWAVPTQGGEAVNLGLATDLAIAPDSRKIALVKKDQIWIGSMDGTEPLKQWFNPRGSLGSPVWSPDGSFLAFTCYRGDHTFIGVFHKQTQPLSWVDPQFSHDISPRWSPDGRHLVFIRTPGSGGAPDSLLVRRHRAWEIRTWTTASDTSKRLWSAPQTLAGSIPTTHGGTNLHWADGRITFLSYHDGWPHLYSMTPDGEPPINLTPGSYMCEHIRLSPDKKYVVAAVNTGPESVDIDRRHIMVIKADGSATEVITPGTGLEWSPVLMADGVTVACISATPQRPPLPTIMSLTGANRRILGVELIPLYFPTAGLVTPRQVKFKAPDGTIIHGQWFEKTGGENKKPGVIYIHGGPPRQMLLGWHYSDYYANAYALNQYLANQGFVVFSVNYRLGIGYGYDFHQAAGGGVSGASEYQDIKAAGEWLARQSSIDPERIGVYGGSYGGYLTAMALARDSKLFAVGVDIHGVHDRTIERTRNILWPDKYERAPDALQAMETAWFSSPVADISSWTSPVLIIHADDDRNVRFSQSTDLVQRLNKQGVETKTMVIVDDTHHFLKHSNSLKVNKATAAFLTQKLMTSKTK